MALINRGNKSASGDTDFATGKGTILASEVDTDFNTAYTEINGELDNDNIKTNAGIDPLKLARPVDAAHIDDHSGSAATAATTTNPGVSASESLATDLEEEIERLRYAIERLSLGVDAARVDGSGGGTTYWGDIPARDLVYADSFEAHPSGTPNATPGWALVSTPGTVELAEADASEGEGKAVHIVGDGAAAANQGLQYTFSGLKASTRYLVGVRAKADTGTARLKTTGANGSSDFRDLDSSTASDTMTSLYGVIQTDATPTNIVVQLVTTANGDDITFDDFFLRECRNAYLPPKVARPVRASANATQTLTAGAGMTDVTNVSVAVTVPTDGYFIEVQAYANGNTASAAAAALNIQIDENGSAVAGPAHASVGSGSRQVGASLQYLNSSPTPGTTYTYKLQAAAVTTNIDLNVGTGDAESAIMAVPRRIA